jgi:hypothetical protein
MNKITTHLAVFSVIAAGALCGIGSANASTGNPNSAAVAKYFEMLSVYDFSVTDENRQLYLTMGNAICGDLRAGTTPDEESKAIFRILPRLDEKDSGELVEAAHIGLCPDA